MIEWLRRIVDPRGPLGAVLSPADVYKERAGLPVATPHAARPFGTTAAVERALAPARFVSVNDAAPGPKVRAVSAFIEEEWAPVYATAKTLAEVQRLAASGPTLIGWRVSQRPRSPHCDCTTARFTKRGDEWVHEACGRTGQHLTDEEFIEIAQTLSIQASDEYYNGLYPTIPGGTDEIVIDGELLRGQPTYDANGKMTHDGIVRGTVIKHGRTEYREKTKGMVLWDKGVVKEREKAIAAEAAAPIASVKEALEATAGAVLPMRRALPNPRYDRMSAV